MLLGLDSSSDIDMAFRKVIDSVITKRMHYHSLCESLMTHPFILKTSASRAALGVPAFIPTPTHRTKMSNNNSHKAIRSC